MAKITEQNADTLIKSVGDKNITSFADLQSASSQEQNEFLGQLNTVLARQSMINTIETRLPIENTWFKENMAVGELEQIRQVLFAKRGQYSQILDVNKHYKAKTVDQYIATVFRDVYEVSLSANVIKSAFLSIQGFGDYVSQYMNTISKTIELTWADRLLRAFKSIPVVYKLDLTKSTKDITTSLGLLLKKLEVISTIWDEAGLPTKLMPEQRVVILDTTLKNKIDYDMLVSTFQLQIIDGELKGLKFYDFGDDGKTLGVIADKDKAFWFDYRIEESTSQSWARTMITDFFNHQWIRATRVEMAVAIRIVDKAKLTESKIDWKVSPFSHYVLDDNGNATGLVKDEPAIIDITDAVAQNLSVPQSYDIDLETAIKIKPNGEVEKDATKLKAWLIDNNMELTNDNFDVINLTDNSFTAVAKDGMNVDSFHDSIVIPCKFSSAPAGKQNADDETDDDKSDK